MESTFKKTVLVIGAMGGIGAATVALLAQKGWMVIAADIVNKDYEESLPVEHIVPIEIDITNQDSINSAVSLVSQMTSGLDAIVNMAGVLKIGSLIEVPASDLENALDVNLLGVFRVNKSFFPLLLKRKGRIVLLSSEVGRQSAAPFNGIYSLTKHALEAYADALRRELAFLGLKVIKIQPGPIRTEMTRGAQQLFVNAEENSNYFRKNISKGIDYLPKVYQQASLPIHVAKTIHRALQSKNPHTAYPVKRDLARRVVDFLPVKWADWLFKKVLS